MKKTLLAAAIVAMSTMGLQAQTVEMINLPKDMAAAEAAGYGQMWGTWEWGALMPANTLLYSDDNVKLTLMSDTYMNYTPAKAGKDIYGPYLYLSSTVDNFVSDPVYDPAAIANTSSGKQGGALKLEPTVDGRVTLAYSSGFNNRSVFVWDMTSTLNEGMGALILANNVEQGAEKGDQMKADGVVDKVHRPTFDVVAGHTYYVFGSNAQQELYSMTFTSFMNDGYVAPVASADGVDAMLLDLPKDMAAAEAAGYGQMWGTWEWGALVPAQTVLFSNGEVKLTLESDTYMNYTPGKAGMDVYGPYIYLSSIADNFVSDPVYDPASLANTSSGKQGGCLKFEPAVDGKVTLYYSSGFNNRSVFVWDMTSTLNEGMGAQILANNIEQGAEKGDQMKADGVKDKVHTPTFDVVGGHTYYIFGSNAQQELYQMTWTSFLKDTYNGSTGIEDATVNVNTKVNENRIYTIDGRYAGTQKSSLVKGLYIMNGKKVVVK